VADELGSWARERAPELLARAEVEAVAALRDALIEAALAQHSGGVAARPPRRRPPREAPPREASPAGDTPQGDALWAYCVLRAGEPLPAEASAIADGGPLERVDAGDLGALVSRVPLAEFGAEPLRENLNDLAWLERVARAHEAVLDGTLRQSTIVPLRLCTIYESAESVREMLEREHDALARALEALAGRQEWGVKLLVDEEQLAEHARARSTETAALEEELGARTGGGAYMLRRRLERHVRETVDALGAELADEVHSQLADLASGTVVLSPQNPELSGHEGTMLLNGAYLVDAERVERMHGLVAELEERHRALGARLVLTGPWPPYNFVPGGDTAALA
jgi:hypothetical protein